MAQHGGTSGDALDAARAALAARDAERLERDPRPRRLGFHFFRIGRTVSKKRGFTYIASNDQRKPFPPFKDHHFGSR